MFFQHSYSKLWVYSLHAVCPVMRAAHRVMPLNNVFLRQSQFFLMQSLYTVLNPTRLIHEFGTDHHCSHDTQTSQLALSCVPASYCSNFSVAPMLTPLCLLHTGLVPLHCSISLLFTSLHICITYPIPSPVCPFSHSHVFALVLPFLYK